MSRKVTVVFADGSKKMAHNLDDRYERWVVRRELNSDDFKTMLKEGIQVPDCRHPADYRQAALWRKQLAQFKENIAMGLQLYKTEFPSNGAYRRRTVGIRAAYTEIEAQLKNLTEYAARGDRDLEPGEYAQDLKSQVKRQAEHIRYLEGILQEERIAFDSFYAPILREGT